MLVLSPGVLLLTLAPRFQALEYTSTTFCQCGEEVLEEKLYPAPYDPHLLLQTCEDMSEEMVESMAKTCVFYLLNVDCDSRVGTWPRR